MRFLTDISDDKYEDVELLYSVSFPRRIRAYLTNLASFKNIPEDHSITVYRKKLNFIASDKNLLKGESE